jgi:hypothetical protein
MRISYSTLIGKALRNRSFRKTRSRWASNIKMDLREIRRDGVNWIQLVQNRLQWRALL